MFEPDYYLKSWWLSKISVQEKVKFNEFEYVYTEGKLESQYVQINWFFFCYKQKDKIKRKQKIKTTQWKKDSYSFVSLQWLFP